METSEWQRFYKTGKIEDYLTYREAVANLADTGKKGEEAINNAGFCNSDGNDFAGASHGRI